MQQQWKNISFALAAMLVGSLITGVVMSLPQGIRHDAYAEQIGNLGRCASEFGDRPRFVDIVSQCGGSV